MSSANGTLLHLENQGPQPGSFFLASQNSQKAPRGAQAPAPSPLLITLPVHPKDDGWTLNAGLGVEWHYPAPSGLIWAS